MFTRYVGKRTNSDNLSSKRSRTESTAGSIEVISEGKGLPDSSYRDQSSKLRVDSLEHSFVNSQTNPNYFEPKIPFTLKAIVNKKPDDTSDLKFRLDILSTKVKVKEVEKNIEISEKQDIIEEKEKKIEDLEKSLVFLASNEKEALDGIKKLEADISELQLLSDQKDLVEKKLRDEINTLREKIISLETDKNLTISELKGKYTFLEADFETLHQENLLIKEHLTKFEENATLKANTPNFSGNISDQLSTENNQQSAVYLSQQLNSSQEKIKKLQIQLHQLSSQASEYKKSHDKYSIALEEKRSLENNVDSLKLELTNLNKTLAGFDTQSQSWSNFFASQNDFKSIDDLWSKFNEAQKILKDKENDVDILTLKLQQRENSLSSMTEENTALKASLESTQKQLQEEQLALNKSEKIVALNQKEIDLLKQQLAIYSSLEEKTSEETQDLELKVE